MVNVENYIPLVHKLTIKRYKQFKHKYSYDDLFQSAFVGLMKAAEKFNEDKGTKFMSYAYHWIDGYLLKTIRDDKWFLTNREDRFKAKGPLSLDNTIGCTEENNKKLTYLDSLNTEDDLNFIDLKIAIEKLPQKLNKVIKLKYFYGLSQREIGKIFNVSQYQISRYEKKALKILKNEIA